MARSKGVRLLAVLAVFAIVGSAWAETPADAQQWVDKMRQAYSKTPLSVGYSAEMNTNSLGQPMTVALDGESIHKDATHMNMKLAVKMTMGTESVDMKVLQVSDGKTMWMEMDNPLMGGKQVLKVSVDQAGQIAAAAGGILGASADPVSQIRDLADKFDFRLVGTEGGLVTLSATMTEKAQADLKDALPLAEAMREMIVVLDEKTAAPKEMRLGGATPFLTVRIASFKHLESVDPALFQYTPAEGVQVLDFDAMTKPEPAGAGS